jgi:hypothetical protein
MNQNAWGLSIMAWLTAGVGPRTADCGVPYTDLTANGLTRHTWSAFSGDVSAPGERRLVGAHCLTIPNEWVNHESGHTTIDLRPSYPPTRASEMSRPA